MDHSELLDLDLTDTERELLRRGLMEWGGPARCTEEMAVAMGFDSVEHLFLLGDEMRAALRDGAPLSAANWCRSLLATEIVFASSLVGAGHDWVFTTGLSDEESLITLRQIQRKMPAAVYRVLGVEIGTRPPRPTATDPGHP